MAISTTATLVSITSIVRAPLYLITRTKQNWLIMLSQEPKPTSIHIYIQSGKVFYLGNFILNCYHPILMLFNKYKQSYVTKGQREVVHTQSFTPIHYRLSHQNYFFFFFFLILFYVYIEPSFFFLFFFFLIFYRMYTQNHLLQL